MPVIEARFAGRSAKSLQLPMPKAKLLTAEPPHSAA
jgi:hypothetical protein